MPSDTVIKKRTLSQLAAEYDGGIRIPMIQRDYAQGRPSWENSRKRFLEDLKKALSGKEPIHLDFVYGLKQTEDNIAAFCPLDGQQRLTTLFLLHWYLAARDGCFADFQRTFRNASGQSRFTYQVRPGGRSFFQALVEHSPSAEECKTTQPPEWFRQQWWFRSIWERDPSVAGGLLMLDAIHEHFKDHPEASFRNLMEGDWITFQKLDLEAVGLHDDLYLRMNARGRPLTTFETFKARFDKLLETKFPDAGQLGRCTVKSAKDFSDKIDKEWLDFIWDHYGPENSNSDDTSSIDEAFINLFRAVALASLEPTKENAGKNITQNDAAKMDSANVTFLSQGKKGEQDKKIYPDYDDFENCAWLTTKFTTHLIHVLEASEPYKNPNSEADSDFILFQPTWFEKDGSLLARVIRQDGKSLEYADFLQFAACIRFLSTHGPVLNEKHRAEFDEWNRVVRNLVINSNVGADTFLEMLFGLDQLIKGGKDKGILAFLAGTEGKLPGFDESQSKEEQLKARLIRADEAGWRPRIQDAENHRYFRGQIDFLLKFSEANPTCEDQSIARSRFDFYWQRSNSMFGDNGLREDPRGNGYLWQRALLAVGDYCLHYRGERWSLLDPGRNSSVTWKSFLQEDHGGKRGYLKELWDRLDINSLEDSLNTVLQIAIQDPWRKALCDTRKPWDYCGERLIYFVGKDVWDSPKAFLLSGAIRSAAYEELYSFCFRMKEGLIIHPPVDNGRFAPLKYAGLGYVSSSYHPHLKFEVEYQGRNLVFQLYCHCHDDNGFSLRIPLKEFGEDRGDIPAFLSNLGFEFEPKPGDSEQNPEPRWLGEHLVLRQDPANPLDGTSFLESFVDKLRQAFSLQPS